VSVAPFIIFFISLSIMLTGLNPSFVCQGFLPLYTQSRASPAPGCYRRAAPKVKRRRSGVGSPHYSDGCRSLNDGDAIEYTVGSGREGPNYARPHHQGRRGGGCPAPSRRPLQRRRRWFLGGSSGLAPSQKQRRFPSPGCCFVPIRLFMRLRRRSCGSGRRLRLNTSASATGVPSWRSAPRRRPASSPLSGPSLSGTARTTKRTSRRYTPRSWR
jgi:hypothetical protein